MPGDIFQLIYTSTFQIGRIDSPLKELREIVRISKINNLVNGITGFLIFDGETFLQILEGERRDVMATFHRIGLDSRHRSTQVLYLRQVGQRIFGDWTMGGVRQTTPIPPFESVEEAIDFAKNVVTSGRAVD